MKRFRDLKKPYKITVCAISALLVILLTLVWTMFAFITVHKTYTYGYTGYTLTRTIAHRGYSGKYFDNTVQSFTAAGEESFFHGIETDIRRTKDGVWVCCHDDNPFVDKNIRITESVYDDIKDLPLDLSGAKPDVNADETYRLPTYEEYLAICASYGKIALIEIKGKYSSEDLAEPVRKAIETLGYSRAYFASFTLESIENVLSLEPYARVLLFAGQSIVAYCYTNMGFSVGVNKKILSEKLINRSHDADTAVFVYTIGSEEEYLRYSETNVDFIITDYAYRA